MGTLTKRGRKWFAQVCVSGTRRSKSFDLKSEANQWILDAERTLSTSHSMGSELPVKHLLMRYKEEVSSKKKHSRHELAVINTFLRQPFAEIRMKDIQPSDIQLWMDDCRASPSESTGHFVKESTIDRRLHLLSSIFSWGVKHHLLVSNPCSGVTRPAKVPHRERVASDVEVYALMYCAGWDGETVPYKLTQRVCAAFVFACNTGMRAGEILGLEESWIEGNLVRLPAESTKTRTGRTVILNSKALKILDLVRQMELSPKMWGMTDESRDALWRKIRDRAGLGPVKDSAGHVVKEGLNFHDARATFCTWAASPGPDGAPRMDVMSLARQTGHKNLQMLMRYYRPDMGALAKRLE